MIKETRKDYLWENISSLPYFRGLLRAVEARFYANIQLTEPVLDLGCGDGHFSKVAFFKPITVGLDPWTKPIKQARLVGNYRWVVQGGGNQLPFPDGYFATAVSNSVLEHIADLEPVLKELNRVLRKDALFIFCVPNNKFTGNLSMARFLDSLGMTNLAKKYRFFFNKISRHHHCDPIEIWRDRLDHNGFMIERTWDYFSPSALAVLEWGHYFGLPSLICHYLFKQWIILPSRWNMAITQSIVEKHYNDTSEHPEGAYSFYIARRL